MALLINKLDKNYLKIINTTREENKEIIKYKPILVQTGYIKLYGIINDIIIIKCTKELKVFADLLDRFTIENMHTKIKKFITIISEYNDELYIRLKITDNINWIFKNRMAEFYKYENISGIITEEQNINIYLEIIGGIRKEDIGWTDIKIKQIMLSQELENEIEEIYSNTRKTKTDSDNIYDNIKSDDESEDEEENEGTTTISEYLDE